MKTCRICHRAVVTFQKYDTFISSGGRNEYEHHECQDWRESSDVKKKVCRLCGKKIWPWPSNKYDTFNISEPVNDSIPRKFEHWQEYEHIKCQQKNPDRTLKNS